MARPKLEEGDHAVQIRISRRVCDLLDNHIRRTMSAVGVLASHEVAASRRDFLDGLIERELGFEGVHPIMVRIHAPMSPSNAAEREEAIRWIPSEENRLTNQAPPAIRKAIERNRGLYDARHAAETDE